MRRASLILVAAGVAVFLAAGMALAATITGTANPDVLTGTAENDVMRGGDGADTMSGMMGSDHLEGGRGADKLYGTDAAQTAMGSSIDKLYGQDGDDQMRGGDGADVLYGGPDNDTIIDGPENDVAVDDIRSGTQSDTIRSANIPYAKDNVSCGDGAHDRVTADPLDVVDKATCENVQVVDAVTVDLVEDRPVAEALQVADSANAESVEVMASYQAADGDDYSAGVVVPNTDPASAGQQVTQTMVSMFEEDIQALQESRLPTVANDNSSVPEDRIVQSAEEEAAEEAATVAELRAVVQGLQADGAKIDDMTVQTGTPTAQIEQDPAVESAIDATPAGDGTEQPPAGTDNDLGDANWVPKRGVVKAACCFGDNNRRFVRQEFEWNRWRVNNLKNKNSRPWYEADALFYRDNGTYLGKPTSWSTNMPRKRYIDTEVGDVSNTRVMTLGTLKAENLRAEANYYTTIRATNGNDNSETMGINGQYGKTVFACNTGAWCALAGWGSDRLILMGSGTSAPGSGSWYSQS